MQEETPGRMLLIMDKNLKSAYNVHLAAGEISY